uniref:Uncharacterized protein n=1 Tax=Oryza sativa subsp. japonica TaxID=39947 RepID=Q6K267_ORYSJ|nr:hypothetical protein [Oryza sativa Japonica Group]BAD20104.1 hypothetical protein [Oryza sativa Japonica Group]
MAAARGGVAAERYDARWRGRRQWRSAWREEVQPVAGGRLGAVGGGGGGQGATRRCRRWRRRARCDEEELPVGSVWSTAQEGWLVRAPVQWSHVPAEV